MPKIWSAPGIESLPQEGRRHQDERRELVCLHLHASAPVRLGGILLVHVGARAPESLRRHRLVRHYQEVPELVGDREAAPLPLSTSPMADYPAVLVLVGDQNALEVVAVVLLDRLDVELRAEPLNRDRRAHFGLVLQDQPDDTHRRARALAVDVHPRDRHQTPPSFFLRRSISILMVSRSPSSRFWNLWNMATASASLWFGCSPTR